jgi:hypothetical protein
VWAKRACGDIGESDKKGNRDHVKVAEILDDLDEFYEGVHDTNR